MGSDNGRAPAGFEIELRLRMQPTEEAFERELRRILDELGRQNRQRLRPVLARAVELLDELDPGIRVKCSLCGEAFTVAVLPFSDSSGSTWRCPSCAHR